MVARHFSAMLGLTPGISGALRPWLMKDQMGACPLHAVVRCVLAGARTEG
jgi:hypothetical protein